APFGRPGARRGQGQAMPGRRARRGLPGGVRTDQPHRIYLAGTELYAGSTLPAHLGSSAGARNVRLQGIDAMKKTAAAAALSLALTTLLVFPEQAGAANGSVTCSVVSTPLRSNAYDPISGAADTLPTGTINVQCTSTSNSALLVPSRITLA